MILENYPGAKTNSGILQWLINNIPVHDRYFELFLGSGQLYKAKRPATDYSILSDIDNSVCGEYWKNGAIPDAFILNCDAIEILLEEILLVQNRGFSKADFIYLDPPYPKTARKSNQSLYKHEMLEDNDHVELLTSIRYHPANIMISTRQNELYDFMLRDWRKETFNTVGRRGPCVEVIYMNYQVPAFLHQYDYVGHGFSDRQRIKRKVDRFASKITMLPTYERQMFIQELIKNDKAAVEFFLTMADATK